MSAVRSLQCRHTQWGEHLLGCPTLNPSESHSRIAPATIFCTVHVTLSLHAKQETILLNVTPSCYCISDLREDTSYPTPLHLMLSMSISKIA